MTQCKVNAMSQAQLIKLLLDGDRTCAELAEESGLHYVTVLDYTRALHKAGAVHIARWDKDIRGRDVLKIYKLGAGKDAKRQRLTSAQRQERVRVKRKAHEQVLVTQGRGRYVQSANGLLRFEAVHQ